MGASRATLPQRLLGRKRAILLLRAHTGPWEEVMTMAEGEYDVPYIVAVRLLGALRREADQEKAARLAHAVLTRALQGRVDEALAFLDRASGPNSEGE